MAKNSGISWTDHTFNPWIGCTKVSPACDFCYAEREADNRYNLVQWGGKGTRRLTSTSTWREPRKWNRDAEGAEDLPLVFCASWADVFEDWSGTLVQPSSSNGATTLDEARVKLFELIDETPNLGWLLLTKRPHNVMRMVPESWKSGFPSNVAIGTTVENQKFASMRRQHMAAIPARRFVSYEPALGEVSWRGWEFLDWLIAGGESGPHARCADPLWFREAQRWAEGELVAFHFKQWGEFDQHCDRVGVKASGRTLDGRTYDARIRLGRQGQEVTA